MVDKGGDKWPNSCYFIGYCFHYLFKSANSIHIYFPSSFFSKRFAKVQVAQPYNNSEMTTTWKNSCFILSVRSDFHIVVRLSIAVHALRIRMLKSFPVDEILLTRYMNWSINFRGLQFNEKRNHLLTPPWTSLKMQWNNEFYLSN